MDFSHNAVLTFKQACEYTGFSKFTMYKLTSSNKVPYSKPNGKSIFFDRVKLEQWLLSNPRKTQAEIAEYADNYVATHPLTA